MTCTGCQAKVQKLLSAVNGIRNVSIDLPKGEASIEMDKHVPTRDLQAALKDYPKYQLAGIPHSPGKHNAPANGKDPAVKQDAPPDDPDTRPWLSVYKPILLIFAYITLMSVIGGSSAGGFDGRAAMRIFMSGFFLTFSFFKMLDLAGFADSYAKYDIVARHFKSWGYLYAFIEAALGVAFALNLQPLLVNLITFFVMSVSIIGVLQSVLNKKKIRCACLGAVFNLPMSTVTIIEDGLMIAMSGFTILEFLLSHPN